MSSLKQDEDYLDEDKPFKFMVKKQNFCILSMLTPNAFPEEKREQYKDQKILGIKVRGVFETYEDAKAQADKLQKQDKFHNIFVGEVGKWLPFNVDISEMQTEDDPVYREQALNKYMKAYKDCLKEEEVSEKQRKEESLKGATVVTDTINAPDYTGLGCPEITAPGVVPESLKKAKETASTSAGGASASTNTEEEDIKPIGQRTVDEQLESTKAEKAKMQNDLEQSKTNLKELESKLSQINQIYAELKK
jgi:hypothetical protein